MKSTFFVRTLGEKMIVRAHTCILVPRVRHAHLCSAFRLAAAGNSANLATQTFAPRVLPTETLRREYS